MSTQNWAYLFDKRDPMSSETKDISIELVVCACRAQG